GHVEYTFYEAVSDSVTQETRRQSCARVEIESRCPTSRESHFKGFSIKDFTDRSSCVINRDEFYGTLRANGNQYGPHFQRLVAVWRAGDQVLGRLAVPRIEGQAGQHSLLPTLVDSIVQLQAAFLIDKGRTFVLRSIDQMVVHEIELPDTLWALATRVTDPEELETGLVGDLDVFDESGRRYLTLSGVTFA